MMAHAVLFAVAATSTLISACSAPAETRVVSAPTAERPVTAIQPVVTDVAPDDPVLKAALDGVDEASRTTARLVARTARAGDQTLTFVYISGAGLCGSGGCNLVVFRRSGETFERVGDLSVVRPPLRLLASSSNGMPDFSVRVSGGGAAAHEALIPFDGRRYASNPTVPPAREIEGQVQGVTVLTDDTPEVKASTR